MRESSGDERGQSVYETPLLTRIRSVITAQPQPQKRYTYEQHAVKIFACKTYLDVDDGVLIQLIL